MTAKSTKDERAYPNLSDWGHRRIIPVELDDDLKVDFRLPDIGTWLVKGRIPNPLRAIAERHEYEGIDLSTPDSTTPEEKLQYTELQAFIIATHLVKPNLVEEMAKDPDPEDERTPEERATDWVMEEMPPEHKAKLWLTAFHISDALLSGLQQLASFRDGPTSSQPVGPIPGDAQSA